MSKHKPAPDAKRCEAGTSGRLDDGGSCGAGQPLYDAHPFALCEHHMPWRESDEGKSAAQTRLAALERLVRR